MKKVVENSFAVTGFVGKDAEIRQFTTASVARFPLAVSRKEQNGEEYVSSFIYVEAWRKNDSTSFELLKKGKNITVKGFFKPDEWTDQQGVKHNRIIMQSPTSMSRWRKKKKKLLSLQKRRKPRKLLNSSFSFQKRLRPFFYVQQIHLRILSFFNQSSLLYHIDSHCTTIKKHIALLARKPAHHFSCGEIRMKPGNSKPHVARMMKIDYCMVDFHIRACLIPSMASFRGCLKKSDMPTCGTEK